MEKFYLPYFKWRVTCDGTDTSFENRRWEQYERGYRWSGSKGKRAFDFLVSLAALLVLFPVLLVAAMAVKLSSRGPVLFCQNRMGKEGQTFVIYKFRTMRVQEAVAGPCVTRAGDSRLTSIGAQMRRWKVDELPQLWNVLKGDMSLVGARPKVPRHQVHPLRYRPGITGAASLAFRDEEHILHSVAHDALDDYQVHVLMPLKVKIDSHYMRRATFLSDLRILATTALGRGERIDHASLAEFQESLLSLDFALRARMTGGVPSSENVRATHVASS